MYVGHWMHQQGVRKGCRWVSHTIGAEGGEHEVQRTIALYDVSRKIEQLYENITKGTCVQKGRAFLEMGGKNHPAKTAPNLLSKLTHTARQIFEPASNHANRKEFQQNGIMG